MNVVEQSEPRETRAANVAGAGAAAPAAWVCRGKRGASSCRDDLAWLDDPRERKEVKEQVKAAHEAFWARRGLTVGLAAVAHAINKKYGARKHYAMDKTHLAKMDESVLPTAPCTGYLDRF